MPKRTGLTTPKATPKVHKVRHLKEPREKYGFLGVLARVPGAPGPREASQGSGICGALREGSGIHHEPNQKTYGPKKINWAIEQKPPQNCVKPGTGTAGAGSL